MGSSKLDKSASFVLFCSQVRHDGFDCPLVFAVSIKRVLIDFSFGKAIAARLCE